MENKKEELTSRQKLFISEYVIDRNATQAAIRAGYAKNSAKVQGARLLTNDNVKKYLSKQIDLQEKRTLITADYVLEGIKEVAERCMQRKKVMVRQGKNFVQKVDENGEGVWEFDAAGANKAFELLGKKLKLFTDKIEMNVQESNFSKLSAAEKAKILMENEKQ